MIQAVIERCAGIDVGKTFVVVCVITGAAEAEPRVETRPFGTFNGELDHLRLWLVSEGCTLPSWRVRARTGSRSSTFLNRALRSSSRTLMM